MMQLLDIMDSVELLKKNYTQVHFAYLSDKYGAVNLLAIFPSMTWTSWIPDCRHRRKMNKTVDIFPTLEFPCCGIKRRGRKRWGPYWFILASIICSILSLSTFFSSKLQSELARSLRLPVLLGRKSTVLLIFLRCQQSGIQLVHVIDGQMASEFTDPYLSARYAK